MSDGWPLPGSPYHAGEQAVQRRAGGREIAERQGRRVIRDHMPEQHRTFFAAQTLAFVGLCDAGGRPWASVLTGAAGFLAAPDPRQLVVAARLAPGDPAAAGLVPGAAVSLVGIAFASRRRNRLTGRVAAVGPAGFRVAVDQSFGNCPQYIQARQPLPDALPARGRAVPIAAADPWALGLLDRADTAFLASASGGRARPVEGTDVNHRGGRPGFLLGELVDGALVVTLPDFAGNRAFSNFGNIAVNPVAGLLVPDFETGDALSLTGAAELLWETGSLGPFAGAERFLRIRAVATHRLVQVLPAPWSAPIEAPQLARTGSWR